ncbi:MAG TPA: TlpA disulfide reductase family protein [Alphaproteobacteria bacterium]|nr:TlpA disulfide reductase family protein [Alphaproteobacteria bacterium]
MNEPIRRVPVSFLRQLGIALAILIAGPAPVVGLPAIAPETSNGAKPGAFALPDFALDPARKSHLASLPALRNTLERAALDGGAVVVNFFASWCPPCQPEFKALVELDTKYRGAGLAIVAVNLFEDWEGAAVDGLRLKRFLDRYAPRFPVVRGSDETKRLFGDVARIPTVLIFHRSGAPALRFIHLENAAKTHLALDELEAGIREALRSDEPQSRL